MNAPGPGIHYGVRLAEYLSWPILSQTVLKHGLASMAHLHAAEEGDRVKVPTDEMLQGSALHVCFLEPDRQDEQVVLWDGPRRAGKEWEAFQVEHAGRIILTIGMYTCLIGMLAALRRHPFVREWSGRIIGTEVAAIAEFEGVMMKGRCDAETEDPLVDLKRVSSCDPRKITQNVLAFGYHIQAAIYRRLFKRQRFVLLCVEDQPPYDIVAYELSPAFIRAGDRAAMALLQKYRECRKSGIWPGRSDEIVTLEPPEWLVDQVEVLEPVDDRACVMLGGLNVFEEE